MMFFRYYEILELMTVLNDFDIRRRERGGVKATSLASILVLHRTSTKILQCYVLVEAILIGKNRRRGRLNGIGK